MTVALVTAAAGRIGSAVVEALLAEKLATRVIAVDTAPLVDAARIGVEPVPCDLRARRRRTSWPVSCRTAWTSW